MENPSENIYKYYVKDLSLFRLAFSNKATLAKMFLGVFIGLSTIYFNVIPSKYKFIYIFLIIILFGIFGEYVRHRIINKNKVIILKYNFELSEANVTKIITLLLLDYIYKKGLLTKDGIGYLIKIYSQKSEKNKFKGIAFGVILISAFTQTLVNFLIMAEEKDWNRINFFLLYLSNNLMSFFVVFFALMLMYIIMRLGLSELLSIINSKSNNYQALTDCLNEKILPFVLKNRNLKDGQKLQIIDLLRNDNSPRNNFKIKIIKRNGKNVIRGLPNENQQKII